MISITDEYTLTVKGTGAQLLKQFTGIAAGLIFESGLDMEILVANIRLLSKYTKEDYERLTEEA